METDFMSSQTFKIDHDYLNSYYCLLETRPSALTKTFPHLIFTTTLRIGKYYPIVWMRKLEAQRKRGMSPGASLGFSKNLAFGK